MLKSIVAIEIKKNDHVYRFEMPVGAQYGEAYDAAFEALKQITQLASEAADRAKPNGEESQENADGSNK